MYQGRIAPCTPTLGKEGGDPAEDSGFEKARILRDRLLLDLWHLYFAVEFIKQQGEDDAHDQADCVYQGALYGRREAGAIRQTAFTRALCTEDAKLANGMIMTVAAITMPTMPWKAME